MVLSHWHHLPIFVSLFSLHSNQTSHVLVLATEEEEQERMEASGQRLKKAFSTLGRWHQWWARLGCCRVGEMCGSRMSPFPRGSPRVAPSYSLALEHLARISEGLWLNLGWLYTMWLWIIPETCLIQRNHRNTDSLAALEVRFLDSADSLRWNIKVLNDSLLSWWHLNLIMMASGAGM